MPYLGPRTFATTPLTITNLAYLNTKLANQNETMGNSDSNSTLTSLQSSTPLSPDSSASSYEDDKTSVFYQDDNKTVVMPNPMTNGSSSSVSTIVGNRLKLRHNDENEETETEDETDQGEGLLDQPFHPLLRKKSGELVKSSLKLPDLKRSKSMPSTSKSVRFAPVLEKVKFFEKAEKPIAVSTDNSPVSSPPPIQHRPTWEFEISSDSDQDSDSGLASSDQTERWEIVHNDVPSNQIFNFAKFNDPYKKIILESLRLGSNKDSLIGFVYVKNLAFEKKLTLQLTVNSWRTSQTIDNANYISSNHIFNYSGNESYDKFSFIIKFSELLNAGSNIDLEFCIKYEVGNDTFWDNNNLKNYRVIVHKITPVTSRGTGSFREHDYFHLVQTKYPGDEDDDEFELDNKNKLLTDVEFAPKCKPRNSDVFRTRYNFDPFSNYDIDDSYFSPPSADKTAAGPSKSATATAIANASASANATAKRTSLGTAVSANYYNGSKGNKASSPGPALPQRRSYSHHYQLRKNNSAPSLVKLSESISKMDLEQSRSSSDLQKCKNEAGSRDDSPSTSQPTLQPTPSLITKDSLASRRNYDQFLQAYCFYGSPVQSPGETSPVSSPQLHHQPVTFSSSPSAPSHLHESTYQSPSFLSGSSSLDTPREIALR
ncbi:unnamed protein product [Kuraishia capsulata CBS 1993]|uniref:CBM21 domain-containing protein n=1 Tax=Kuraishia capsulata CBS 1993 TaxID=1382522 RepID=W6MHM4_9ASCO|nr:uncharacterized protein KUCA_T00001225001 [Kuraishia capsulata CBS 1993]CDK25258.1 unnamed protein product [Kuraishia capsulata CBS 1993]